MKKRCLSEEIFEELSHEESHYKRRSFQRKMCKIRQDDKKYIGEKSVANKIKVVIENERK